MREDLPMKDINRRKFVGRLATVAALSFLVPWAFIAREAEARHDEGADHPKRKTKTKTKTKTKGGE